MDDTQVMLESNRILAIGALVLCAIAIVVWANWPAKPSKQQTFSYRPYMTAVNNWCRHDFYRGVSHQQITSHWGDNAFDYTFLIAESTADCNWAVVRVFNWVGKVHFRTEFRLDDGNELQIDWQPAKEMLFGEATGLFMIPRTAVTAKTEVLS